MEGSCVVSSTIFELNFPVIYMRNIKFNIGLNCAFILTVNNCNLALKSFWEFSLTAENVAAFMLKLKFFGMMGASFS